MDTTDALTIQRDEKPSSESPNEQFIQIKDFNFWYGDAQALHDLSFNIPEQQVTAFIGPSGCGKTTLLKIMAGLLKPTEGEIIILFIR